MTSDCSSEALDVATRVVALREHVARAEAGLARLRAELDSLEAEFATFFKARPAPVRIALRKLAPKAPLPSLPPVARPDGSCDPLIGQKIEGTRLTVLARVGHNPARWRVRCDCGKEKVVKRCNVLAKFTRSCGCLRREANERKRKRPRVEREPLLGFAARLLFSADP